MDKYLKYMVLILAGLQTVSGATRITIEELQGHTSSSPYVDSIVEVVGVVTGVYTNTGVKGYTLEEKYPASGPWHGVFVYTGVNPTVSVGDSVIVVGQVKEYYGLTELNQDSVYILASGVRLPEPYEGSTGEVGAEAFEGVLVKIQHAVCVDTPNNYGEWVVDDGSGQLMVDDLGWTPTGIQRGQKYNIVGTIYYSYGSFKLEPRSAADVEVDTANIPPLIKLAYIDPRLPDEDQMVNIAFLITEPDNGDSVIADTMFVLVNGSLEAKLVHTQRNGDTFKYEIDRHSRGTKVYFYVKAIDSRGGMSVSDTFYYIVNPGDEIIPISYLHMLDEKGHSLFLGHTVKITGIITAAGEFGKKYYMQDTSGGVALYNPSSTLHEGDSVVIEGTVTEFGGLVELSNATASYIDPGHTYAPLTLTCAELDSGKEKYEGMFVRILDARISGTVFQSGNTLTVQDTSGSFTLYVDPYTDLGGKPVPQGEMIIQGVISQYDPDSTNGYFDGYQIVPRGVKDIRASGSGSGKVFFFPAYLHKGDTQHMVIKITGDLGPLNAARFYLDEWADTSSISVDGALWTLDQYYHLTLYNFSKDTVSITLKAMAPDTEKVYNVVIKTSATDTNSLTEMLQSPYKLYITTPISKAQEPGEDGYTPADTGKIITVAGVVVGPNKLFSSTMTNLWIQDDSAGIEVFYYSPIQPYDTGDVVVVKGRITEYNGLTEIVPSSSSDIIKVGKAPVPEPIEIPESHGLWEGIEGSLVKVKGELANDPYLAGSGYNLIIWNGMVPITVYVYQTTGIDVKRYHKGDILEVIGIASQYDKEPPYNSGYQVLPRYQEDIEVISAPVSEKVELTITPNVVDKVNEGYCTITVSGPQKATYTLKIYDRMGRLVKDLYGAPRVGPGNAVWRLDDEKGAQVPIGYYIVKVEAILEDGSKEVKYKSVIVSRPK